MKKFILNIKKRLTPRTCGKIRMFSSLFILLIPFIILFIIIMISIIVSEQERLSKIYTWSWPDIIKTLKLTLCIFIGGFLTIKYILPFVLFSVRRFTTYLSLIFFCIFHKCRFKIKKVPFTSLRGISENCDIEIITDSKIFCIHFIDIPFRFKRSLIVIDDKQYSISKTMPLKLGWLGAGGRFIKGGIRFLLGTGHTIIPSYITTGHIITKEKIRTL